MPELIDGSLSASANMIDAYEIFLEGMNVCRDDIRDMDEISCLRAIAEDSRVLIILDFLEKY